MLDWCRARLGLLPTDAEKRLSDVIAFSDSLYVQFHDRLPAHHHSNLSLLTAWWAIPLTTQLPKAMNRYALPEDMWHTAAHRLAERLLFRADIHLTDDSTTWEAMRDATGEMVLKNMQLWSALLGPWSADKEYDPHRIAEKVEDMLENEELGIAEIFGVPEMQHADRWAEMPQEAFDIRTDRANLCEGFGLFFNICANSQM